MNTVDNFNLSDSGFNRSFSRREFMKLSAAVGMSALVTHYLSGCGSKKIESEVASSSSSEDDIVDDMFNKDMTEEPAAYAALEALEKANKKLKNDTDELRKSGKLDPTLRKAMENFDVIYEYLVNADDTSEIDKKEIKKRSEMIDATMSFKEIVNTMEPNYKEEVNKKYNKIKKKWSNFMKEHHVREKAVDIGADAMEKGSEAWKEIKEFGNDVKKEYKSRKK